MPRRPLEPKLTKGERKSLARRMRALLSRGPIATLDITSTLEVEPELVAIGLRELRRRRNGKIRSGIKFGHVCWWWEPVPMDDGETGAVEGSEYNSNPANLETALVMGEPEGGPIL